MAKLSGKRLNWSFYFPAKMVMDTRVRPAIGQIIPGRFCLIVGQHGESLKADSSLNKDAS
jgi:hypothetical protein